MNRSTKRIISGSGLLLAAVLICVLMTCCMTLSPDGIHLVITEEDAGIILCDLPIGDIEQVSYTYTQSYDRGEIRELFYPVGGSLIPTQMFFDTDSYDYHGSRYPDSTVTKEGDIYRVDIHEAQGYRNISYRIGYTIEQVLEIKTEAGMLTIRFQDIGEPGDLVTVRLH